MTLTEYASHDATSLAAQVKSGAVGAAELVSLALRACALVDPQLGAVIEHYPEPLAGVKGGCREASRYSGRGAFAGVPFLLKDVGAAEAGRPQAQGSQLLRGYVVSQTAPLAQRSCELGLITVGRSAAPEFALSLSTESVLYGPTQNPWDPGKLAGGSSGGAAAAVAGIVPLAHATDAAGSVRIPASACGLVGLKPSRARFPATRQAPGLPPILDMNTEFVLSKTLRDCSAMLEALSEDPAETALKIPRQSYLAPTTSQSPLRVAVTTTAWGRYAIDAGIAAGVATIADDLERLGHHVAWASPVFDYDHFIAAATVGWAWGVDKLLEGFAADLERPLDLTTLEPVTFYLYQAAKKLTPAALARAVQAGDEICRSVDKFFKSYNLLLTPTLIQPPEPLGKYSQNRSELDFEAFFRLCDESGVFLPLFNLTGQPALSLPLLATPASLPLGVQLVARHGAEATLLQVADDLQLLRPWAARRPALHVATLESERG